VSAPVIVVPCPKCGGAGEIHVLEYDPFAREPWEWSGKCPECNGTGEVLAYDLGQFGLESIAPAPQETRAPRKGA